MTVRWQIYESSETQKMIYILPRQVRLKYEYWKIQILEYGPDAVSMHRFPGFKDHALKGKWVGYRSSRLSKQYRVIYRIDEASIIIEVKRIGPHDY